MHLKDYNALGIKCGLFLMEWKACYKLEQKLDLTSWSTPQIHICENSQMQPYSRKYKQQRSIHSGWKKTKYNFLILR